ncbi:hypothetical protein LXL04_026565 [Taraxacum kok-saghyz]
MASPSDLENAITSTALPYSYSPLPDGEQEQPAGNDSTIRPCRKTASFLFLLSVLLTVGFLVSLFTEDGTVLPKTMNSRAVPASAKVLPEKGTPSSRGVDKGVSEKSFHPLLGIDNSYPWSNNMLDLLTCNVKSPVFYNGWYHLFYQYQPDAPVWGKIVWGHAVSKDLINWRHLPIAMETDEWYDEQGVWTGSATILPDGQLVVLYTGSTKESVQVQNLAYPADPSDPLLINWVKYPGNPVLVPPPGIDNKDFRDPTTAWKTPEGKWRITIGSKINKTERKNGLDTSVDGPEVKHVVKASMDDVRNDYYAIGTYDANKGKWTPDNPTLDTDTEASDIKKGWASLMGVPRTIMLDKKTQRNIIQWPVHEINRLRTNVTVFKEVMVEPGSLVPLNLSSAAQFDIMAEFEIDKKMLEELDGADVPYNCAKSGGAAQRSALGPIGFSVLCWRSGSKDLHSNSFHANQNSKLCISFK